MSRTLLSVFIVLYFLPCVNMFPPILTNFVGAAVPRQDLPPLRADRQSTKKGRPSKTANTPSHIMVASPVYLPSDKHNGVPPSGQNTVRSATNDRLFHVCLPLCCVCGSCLFLCLRILLAFRPSFPAPLVFSLCRSSFPCAAVFSFAPVFSLHFASFFRRMLFVRSDFSHFLFFAMTGRPRDGILERPVPLFLYSFFVFHVRSLCDMLFSLFYHLFILLIRYLFICSVVLIFISGSPLLTC